MAAALGGGQRRCRQQEQRCAGFDVVERVWQDPAARCCSKEVCLVLLVLVQVQVQVQVHVHVHVHVLLMLHMLKAAGSAHPTCAGCLKARLCEAYTAPGKREPMMAGNRLARSMPGSTVPFRPAGHGRAWFLLSAGADVGNPGQLYPPVSPRR